MKTDRRLIRRLYCVAMLMLIASGAAAASAEVVLPKPKVGLVVTEAELTRVRSKIKDGVPAQIWQQVLTQMPKTLETLEALRSRTWPAPGASWDEGRGNQADAIQIQDTYFRVIPLVAMHYLVTGKPDGVGDALWCMRQMKHYVRAGWFTWDGGSFPQIRYGGLARVTAYAYDWMYEAMDADARADVEAYLLMAARDYCRIDLVAPGMVMHHFRHHNQGANAFCSGLAATLVTRELNPDAPRWCRAFVETYLWKLNNAFGPNGEGMEGDLGGYWGIAFDAVTQDAIMLRNMLGVDFLDHPHLRRAYTYWLAHLAPCRPVLYTGGSQRQDSAYDEVYDGYSWVHDAPACTVHKADPSTTLLYYAARCNDGQALDLWLRSKVRKDGTVNKSALEMAHTGTLGALLALTWYPADLTAQRIEGPLVHFSERLALLRSGLVPGRDSLLTFNGGQVNFIERGEQFGTGVGLVWHNRHFHYANAQSTLWTEGVDLQPAYKLTSSYQSDSTLYFSAKGAFSNTHYYPHREQLTAHEAFTTLERDVLHTQGGYWVILDRVSHAEPKAHSFTWNTLNTDRQASYSVHRHGATLTRRQAALDFHFAEPEQVSCWQNQTYLMPFWNFSWSGHGLALYAQAGAQANDIAENSAVDLARFQGVARVESTSKTPSIKVPLGFAPDSVKPEGGKRRFAYDARLPVTGGHFYTLEMDYSHTNAKQYRDPAWQLIATFYDAAGKALNTPSWENPCSACLTELDGEVADLGPVTAHRRVSVPLEARSVALELQTWHFSGMASAHLRNAPDRDSELTVHAVRLLRHAPPDRTKEARFVTIMNSRPTNAVPLAVKTDQHSGGSVSRFDTGASTQIVVSGERLIEDKDGLFRCAGRLGTLTLAFDGKLLHAYLERFTRFESAALGLVLEASQPVTLEIASDGTTVKCAQTSRITLSWGKARLSDTLDKGYYRFEQGRLQAQPERFDQAIEQPPQDLAAYQKATASYFDAIQVAVASGPGERNLLTDSLFRASSVLQERFAPDLVNDGRVLEAYGDGRFYYDEPEIPSAPREGYSGSGHNGWYPWPYRTRPTYWLAKAEQKDAWVEAELPELRSVASLRLHNTYNAGFNDRAMIDFRVDLFDAQGNVIKSVSDHFGKPFAESVSYPGQSYTSTWRFWFAPDTPIPHGEGFKTIELGGVYLAKRIRVTCLRYWGYGAGLNEMQAFGPEQR